MGQGQILRKAGLTWLALMLLLVATVIGAYSDIGAWKLPLSMAIAVAKTLLVMMLFMELWQASASARFAAMAGLVWLGLLFSLTFADEATREHTQPGFCPPDATRQAGLASAEGCDTHPTPAAPGVTRTP